MEQDLNNFHGYFPGGFYRLESLEHINKDIKETIDRLIQEDNFDMERYERIHAIVNTCGRRMGELWDVKNVERVLHYADRKTKFSQLRNEMILPIYEKMVAMGYSEKTLTG